MNKLFLIAALGAFTLPAQALYKCVDDKGVTHYGDTMPAQCATKAYSEMNGGSVVRKVEAPLTPEQIKVREEANARRKIEDAKIAEVKRMDMALLDIYTAEKDFDVSRDRDLAQIDARVASLNQLAKDLDAQVIKVNNEMEFYKAGKSKATQAREPPAQLTQKLKSVTKERESMTAELARLDKDKEAVVQKHDANKQRWKLLKNGLPAGTLPTVAPAPAASIAPAPAPIAKAGAAPITKVAPAPNSTKK